MDINVWEVAEMCQPFALVNLICQARRQDVSVCIIHLLNTYLVVIVACFFPSN